MITVTVNLKVVLFPVELSEWLNPSLNWFPDRRRVSPSSLQTAAGGHHHPPPPSPSPESPEVSFNVVVRFIGLDTNAI